MVTSMEEARSNVEEKSQSTANIAHPGIGGKANVFSITSKNSTWIIDTDASFEKFLNQHGIRHNTSYTYAPQQNGLAERKNRQIIEVVRTFLFGMNMPWFYWEEAVKKVSTPSLQEENFSEESMLQEGNRGDEFFELKKMNEKFGTSNPQNFDNISVIENEEVVPSEDKSQSPMAAELPMLIPLTDESTQNVQNSSPQVISSPISSSMSNEFLETNISLENFAPRYLQRSNKGVPKKQYEPDPKVNVKYPISIYVSTHRLSKSYALTVNQLSKISIPSSVQDALADPKWTKAMNEEMEALQKNSTWELVSLPKGKKMIGCR
ncbi:uncharacterized protein [Elaeis guineensis]|uniref:uncharacterized protein n=1 Tax=Elaeis guineensis var. tenera TaxID=51953 RepID=UPI003C6DAEB3